MKPDATHTDFGYRRVPPARKRRLVDEVFSSVAGRYDVMNDLMSAGLHRWWKRYFIASANIKSGGRVLDLAAGTGDVTRLLAEKVGNDGAVIASDINRAMLWRGRDRLLNDGMAQITYAVANAESLPWRDNQFDAVTMAFGLRNVTDKALALAEIKRVLKPGAGAYILEFSQPNNAGLRKVYGAYSFGVLPRLGRWVAGDEAGYRYLAESIRKHPNQDALLAMMEAAGFERVRYRNLSAGIVAIHSGCKL